MNCPKCNFPDFYQGLTSQACENVKCELYVKPGVPVSSREGADGSTVWDEDRSESRPASASTTDASPSESQGGTHPAPDSADYDGDKDTDPFAGLDIDWTTVRLRDYRGTLSVSGKPYLTRSGLNLCFYTDIQWKEASRRQRYAKRLSAGWHIDDVFSLQAKPETANTLLSEVHEDQNVAAKSQLQQLEDSLQSIRSLLEDQEGYLKEAKQCASVLGLDLDLRDIAFSLDDLHATLRQSEALLEQCDQSHRTQQSVDQHPLENHKSEDTCQTDTVHFHVPPPKTSKYEVGSPLRVTSVDRLNGVVTLCSEEDYLASTSSNSQPPSCETQSHECQTVLSENISHVSSLGFQTWLSSQLPAGFLVERIYTDYEIGRVEVHARRAGQDAVGVQAVSFQSLDVHSAKMKSLMKTAALDACKALGI